MENQAAYPAAPSKPPKKRRPFVVLVVVLIFLGVGIYFFALVQKNIKNINSGQITNQEATGEIATADDPYAGNPEAKIVIVEFSDFQCPFCFQAFPVVREVIETYGDKIKFIYRDFPIAELHPDAQKAAEAGECAQEQGKFWEMHDKIFLNQNDLSVPALKRYAGEIGLDTVSFSECLDSGRFAAEVKQDFSDGLFAGVDGTPTFFINGTKFSGAITYETFQTIIEQLISMGY